MITRLGLVYKSYVRMVANNIYVHHAYIQSVNCLFHSNAILLLVTIAASTTKYVVIRSFDLGKLVVISQVRHPIVNL